MIYVSLYIKNVSHLHDEPSLAFIAFIIATRKDEVLIL